MKTTLKVISLLILGFVIGWYTSDWYTNQSFSKSESEIVKIDNKIDSLEKKDSIITVERTILRDNIIKVSITKEVEINNVKSLPLDSGIIFLRNKLEEYE
jgi:hypothetical protein